MEFDKSRVFSAANADELHMGDKVICANDMGHLKHYVTSNGAVLELKSILDENNESRFVAGTGKVLFHLAYLIERAENCTNCGARWVCPMGIPKNPKLTRCSAYETLEPNTKRNLCDSCKHSVAECPATFYDVKFGDGVGNDNVYECDKYEKKDKHYRPFSVNGFAEDGVVLVNEIYDFDALQKYYTFLDALQKYYTFLDGSPCGVEE